MNEVPLVRANCTQPVQSVLYEKGCNGMNVDCRDALIWACCASGKEGMRVDDIGGKKCRDGLQAGAVGWRSEPLPIPKQNCNKS